MTQDSFTPHPLLRNPHLQSIFASTGPRKLLVRNRARRLLDDATTHLLHCSDGVRLQGELSMKADNHKGLVIMIHGWEGCANSLYLLSSGARLYQQGYNIFRLNLRDHGPTHHLNPQLFNSARIEEVIDAVKEIQSCFPHHKNFMAGFSLGGNFCLRVAASASEHEITLNQVVAVCPVLNPLNTMDHLSNGWFVYHDYFHYKWQSSLRKKLQYFPELGYGDVMPQLKTLKAMNDFFVPNHTAYDDTTSYLLAYSLIGDVLEPLNIPCQLITSMDDPMIHAKDLADLASNKQLSIELTRYGGHCGFIENLKLESWVDRRMVDIFDSTQ